MNERRCPVCGDPRPYKLWIGHEGPPCPHGAYKVTDCAHQMGMARRDLAYMRVAPDCFDASGAMLPGRLGDVLTRMQDAKLNPWTGEPADA